MYVHICMWLHCDTDVTTKANFVLVCKLKGINKVWDGKNDMQVVTHFVAVLKANHMNK